MGFLNDVTNLYCHSWHDTVMDILNRLMQKDYCHTMVVAIILMVMCDANSKGKKDMVKTKEIEGTIFVFVKYV